ncbi:MAG: hypothetical protein, partial [Olavius algarvensis Gamma 1 endosymbiont]
AQAQSRTSRYSSLRRQLARAFQVLRERPWIVCRDGSSAARGPKQRIEHPPSPAANPRFSTVPRLCGGRFARSHNHGGRAGTI